jgi:APA family basic amino acid/polyamine antiporter
MALMYHAAVHTASTPPKLRLASGVGMVAANMIGAGVFLSAGFMAQDMGPGHILLAWGAGAALALCGAVAYGAVARLVPRSGGEYRYLSELLHPAVGYLGGWASLLVGFSAPVAMDALAAGAFASAIFPGLNSTWIGAGFVVLLTGFHAVGFRASFRTQNLLVAVKAALLIGFVGVGLFLGARGWPTWTPPNAQPGFPLGPFASSLFYIALAFSGWNAAIYAAEEFEDPARTVPRAMIIGTLLVAALYLLVNWIFVANLDPATAFFTVTGDNGTLGHAVMTRLLGPTAGAVWSMVTVLVFLSAMSAMIFLGPRVYAAMAADGFLPRFLRANPQGHPPRAAILLQGAITLLIIFTQGLRETLGQVGAILVLFAALVALGLLVARARGMTPTPSKPAVAAAIIYVVSSAWMFWKGFGEQPRTLVWVAGVAVIGVMAWALSRRPAAGASAP